MVANGPPYSDAERVVLMLIYEHHEDLSSDQATKVFNTVFNNQTRSRISLILTWHGRHASDQQEAWNRLRDQPQAGHDLATRKQWLKTINAAVEQLDRPLEGKPQRPATAQWNDNMRLVLFLLIKDTSVDACTRKRIFNTIFQDVLTDQGVAPLSKEALRAQWGLRKRMRKTSGEGSQGEGEKTAVAQRWQRIIDRVRTGEDQANVVRWQNMIEEQKEESEEDEGEAEPQQSGRGERPSIAAHPQGLEDGAPTTVMGKSRGKAIVKAVVKEDNIQEDVPEASRQFQEGGGDIVTPIQHSLLLQRAIIEDVLRSSGPERAAEVRRLFEKFNRNTLDVAKMAVRLLRTDQALQKRKRQ